MRTGWADLDFGNREGAISCCDFLTLQEERTDDTRPYLKKRNDLCSSFSDLESGFPFASTFHVTD
jgi:hypothetical protein